MIRILVILFSICLMACNETKEQKYLLTDGEFTDALMDIEFAREAAQSAPYAYRDSLFDTYLKSIALRYQLEREELVAEIENRLESDEDFADVYDILRKKVDSLDNPDSPGQEE